jgi:hypothetical protein
MLAIDNQLATLSVNITLESSMRGIVFEHVDPTISIERFKWIVTCNQDQ